jgi:hypothetical protein
MANTKLTKSEAIKRALERLLVAGKMEESI